MGFDQMDRMILLTIIDKFGGGPVGLDTIGAAISEDSDTIEDVYEPFLIQNGFLNRTPRGRVATPAAYRHFGRLTPELSPGITVLMLQQALDLPVTHATALKTLSPAPATALPWSLAAGSPIPLNLKNCCTSTDRPDQVKPICCMPLVASWQENSIRSCHAAT
jgi:hypothetical protein